MPGGATASPGVSPGLKVCGGGTMLKHKGFPLTSAEHGFPVHDPPRPTRTVRRKLIARETLCRPQARRPPRRRGLRRGAVAVFRGRAFRAGQSRRRPAQLAVRARGDPGRGSVRPRKLRGVAQARRGPRARLFPRGLRRQRHLGGPVGMICTDLPGFSGLMPQQARAVLRPPLRPRAPVQCCPCRSKSPAVSGRPRQTCYLFPFNAVGQATVPIRIFFYRNRRSSRPARQFD